MNDPDSGRICQNRKKSTDTFSIEKRYYPVDDMNDRFRTDALDFTALDDFGMIGNLRVCYFGFVLNHSYQPQG